MEDLASRLANRVQLTSDGHRPYFEAVEGAFGADIDYAMLVKIYGAPEGKPGSPERRYGPAECIRCQKQRVQGEPDPKHISTSFAERQSWPQGTQSLASSTAARAPRAATRPRRRAA
jgi:hypothetical protein